MKLELRTFIVAELLSMIQSGELGVISKPDYELTVRECMTAKEALYQIYGRDYCLPAVVMKKEQGIVNLIDDECRVQKLARLISLNCLERTEADSILNMNIAASITNYDETETDYMKAGEVMNRLGISRQTLSNWTKRGIIRAKATPGGQYEYESESVKKAADPSRYQKPSSNSSDDAVLLNSFNISLCSNNAGLVAKDILPWLVKALSFIKSQNKTAVVVSKGNTKYDEAIINIVSNFGAEYMSSEYFDEATDLMKDYDAYIVINPSECTVEFLKALNIVGKKTIVWLSTAWTDFGQGVIWTDPVYVDQSKRFHDNLVKAFEKKFGITVSKRLEIVKNDRSTAPEEAKDFYNYTLKYYINDELVYDETEMETHDLWRHFCNAYGYSDLANKLGEDEAIESLKARGVKVVFIE